MSDLVNNIKMEDDKKLENSRRNLLITSVVLLALNLANAKLEKVNGLIFEMTFETPERLKVLLAVAVIFLLIRYFNYAYKYHHETYQKWTSNLMRDDLMFRTCEHSDNVSGYVHDLAPKSVDYSDIDYGEEGSYLRHSFNRRLVFNSTIVYERTFRGNELPDLEVSILVLWAKSKKDYFRFLKCVLSHWFSEVIKSPLTLYLYSPYLIGGAALMSFL